MNTIGFVQTNDRHIFELVDELSNYRDEYNARIFDEYCPNRYIRIIDREFGISGVFKFDDIRLIFKFKNI